MDKHTPGPWFAQGCDVKSVGRNSAIICWTGAGEHTLETARANARLIAAAPELLAALRRLEAFAAGFEDDETQQGVGDMLAAARAAIAKAES